MKPLPTLVAAALVLAPGLFAGQARAQTTLELDAQAGRDFTAADHDLNATYRRLTPRLSPAARKALQAAQLAWIPYRDTWADYVSDGYRGGTLASLTYTSSRARLTVTRVKDFEHVLASLGQAQAPRAGAREAALHAAATLALFSKAQRQELDGPGRLLEAQAELAWNAYRDAELAFTAAWQGAGARDARLVELLEARYQVVHDARQE